MLMMPDLVTTSVYLVNYMLKTVGLPHMLLNWGAIPHESATGILSKQENIVLMFQAKKLHQSPKC